MIKPLRALHGVLALIGVAMLTALVVVLSMPSEDKIVATGFERAQLCIEPALEATRDRASLSELLLRSPTTDCQQSVSLPHRQSAEGIKVIVSRKEPIARAWYRIRYAIPAGWTVDDRLTVYSPRVLGVAWQVRVNDSIVADNLNDWRMTWNRPLAATVNTARFSVGDQVDISIGIAFEPEVGYALARVSAGPADALTSRLATRQLLQFSMPIACCVTLLTMGAFFLVFWWLRRGEQMHLLLALSCIAWCVYNLQPVLPRRDEAVLDAWYSAITGSAITWAIWLLYLFVMQFDARFSKAVAIIMPPFVLLMSYIASPLTPFRLDEEVGVFYQGANIVVATAIAVRVGWVAIRGGSVELRVIATALILAIAAGVHDWVLLARWINPESIYLLPYSSMLIFGAFLFAVQRRYVRAIDEHERLSSSLAQRLSEREDELRANHLRLLELERVQTLATERQRLMHDMHDGLGSALTTSLAMIEQGNVDGEELKSILRDSVDDLRAVIDSLEPLDGDLISVLATLRFRLGKRLELAGVKLTWDMQDLPQLHWLGSPQALHLIRIVQEVLTNILKHAAASLVKISARCSGPYIEVCIADDGCGFNVATTLTGRGLRHLTQRAASLHGSVLIESEPGSGTTVRLLLPITTRMS